ncbi:hypothetical protein HNR27_000202 [Ornithinibacillus bavariensis]
MYRCCLDDSHFQSSCMFFFVDYIVHIVSINCKIIINFYIKLYIVKVLLLLVVNKWKYALKFLIIVKKKEVLREYFVSTILVILLIKTILRQYLLYMG